MSERRQETSNAAVAVARAVLPALLFAVFPVGLVWPTYAGFPLIFHLELPVLFWAGLFCAVALCIGLFTGGMVRGMNEARVRWNDRLVLWTVVAVAWVFASLLMRRPRHSVAAVTTAALLLIPLWTAAAPRRLLPRAVTWRRVLLLLWLLHVSHALWQAALGQETVGLVGNRNWLAALLAALIPWLWIGRRRADRSAPAHWGAVCATGVTLFLLILCRSRAVWLALGAYALLYAPIPRLSRVGRGVLLSGLTGIIGLAFWTWPAPFIEQWERDIRPPLWVGTARMIADHPVFGVGPGNFRRVYVRYRSAAHHARPDVAPVTEHPHNETLRLAAEAGIPVALVWLAWLAPLLTPPRGGGLLRASHMSAFVLVLAGQFDKTLVRPPDALLAAICLGLLWRRRMHVRLDWPWSRPAGGGVVRVLLPAGLAVVWAVIVGMRDVGAGWYWRKAWLLEAEGRFPEAYAAYCKAELFKPGDVRAWFYAGDIAVRRLREPRLALKHLDRARCLEPDFAHIHRDFGLAYVALGDASKALAAFQREARLYPYEPAAWRDLFATYVRLERWSEAESARRRFLEVAIYRRRQRLGRCGLMERGARWLLAVRRGDDEAAVRIANELVSRLPSGGAEPGFAAVMQRVGLPADVAGPVFTVVDARWWRWLDAVRRSVVQRRVREVPDLLREYRSRGQRGRKKGEPPNPFDPDLAEFARQVGIEAARVDTDGVGTTTGARERVWVFHDGVCLWLVAPDSGALLHGEDFAALWTALQAAVPGAAPSVRGRLLLRASPLDFCYRTQLLAALVREGTGRIGPLFGDSPALRRSAWEALITTSSRRDGRAAVEPVVEYDPEPFVRLARALGARRGGRRERTEVGPRRHDAQGASDIKQ